MAEQTGQSETNHRPILGPPLGTCGRRETKPPSRFAIIISAYGVSIRDSISLPVRFIRSPFIQGCPFRSPLSPFCRAHVQTSYPIQVSGFLSIRQHAPTKRFSVNGLKLSRKHAKKGNCPTVRGLSEHGTGHEAIAEKVVRELMKGGIAS